MCFRAWPFLSYECVCVCVCVVCVCVCVCVCVVFSRFLPAFPPLPSSCFASFSFFTDHPPSKCCISNYSEPTVVNSFKASMKKRAQRNSS